MTFARRKYRCNQKAPNNMKRKSMIQWKRHLIYLHQKKTNPNGNYYRNARVRTMTLDVTCGLKWSNTYPKILSLSALLACNGMTWPGGIALCWFHHWLMLYTLGVYIVNVQWSRSNDSFLTIFIFGLRGVFFKMHKNGNNANIAIRGFTTWKQNIPITKLYPQWE